MTKQHPDILNTAFPNEIFGKDVDTREWEAPRMTGKQKIGATVMVILFIALWALASHYDYWFAINQ